MRFITQNMSVWLEFVIWIQDGLGTLRFVVSDRRVRCVMSSLGIIVNTGIGRLPFCPVSEFRNGKLGILRSMVAFIRLAITDQLSWPVQTDKCQACRPICQFGAVRYIYGVRFLDNSVPVWVGDMQSFQHRSFLLPCNLYTGLIYFVIYTL